MEEQMLITILSISIVGITSLISFFWNIHAFRHFERDKRIEGKISLIIYIVLSAFGVVMSAFLLIMLYLNSRL